MTIGLPVADTVALSIYNTADDTGVVIEKATASGTDTMVVVIAIVVTDVVVVKVALAVVFMIVLWVAVLAVHVAMLAAMVAVDDGGTPARGRVRGISVPDGVWCCHPLGLKIRRHHYACSRSDTIDRAGCTSCSVLHRRGGQGGGVGFGKSMNADDVLSCHIPQGFRVSRPLVLRDLFFRGLNIPSSLFRGNSWVVSNPTEQL